MLPKSDFSLLHFFLSLPSFCVAVSKLKGEIKSCQRLVSKYEISWRKEKCQIFAFFPLQNRSDLILDIPHSMNLRKGCVSHLSNHAMPFIQDLAKVFEPVFAATPRHQKRRKQEHFVAYVLNSPHLKSHSHNHPMPYLQIWAEISVMFTLMCIVYAGTRALSWISLGSLPQ